MCCSQGNHTGTSSHLVGKDSTGMVVVGEAVEGHCYSGNKDGDQVVEQYRKDDIQPPQQQQSQLEAKQIHLLICTSRTN